MIFIFCSVIYGYQMLYATKIATFTPEIAAACIHLTDGEFQGYAKKINVDIGFSHIKITCFVLN